MDNKIAEATLIRACDYCPTSTSQVGASQRSTRCPPHDPDTHRASTTETSAGKAILPGFTLRFGAFGMAAPPALARAPTLAGEEFLPTPAFDVDDEIGPAVAKAKSALAGACAVCCPRRSGFPLSCWPFGRLLANVLTTPSPPPHRGSPSPSTRRTTLAELSTTATGSKSGVGRTFGIRFWALWRIGFPTLHCRTVCPSQAPLACPFLYRHGGSQRGPPANPPHPPAAHNHYCIHG
jgi:hypothetical protein